MMLRSFAAAAILLVATRSDLCLAADQRLLVLEGSWVKWGEPRWGAGAIVTYGFAQTAVKTPTARNCASLVPFEEVVKRTGLADSRLRDEAEAAFSAWSRITGLTFVEAPDPNKANILIGAQGNPSGWAFTNIELASGPFAQAPATERGFASTPETRAGEAEPHSIRSISQALICFNPLAKWKIGFDGNLNAYDVRYTFMHEIGHAIGLDHPGVAGALMDFRYDEKLKGPTPSDRDAAQALYGPDER